jgi:hypothetical protein
LFTKHKDEALLPKQQPYQLYPLNLFTKHKDEALLPKQQPSNE